MKARPYPRSKFSQTNNLSDQLKHIRSEVREVSEALTDMLMNGIENNGRIRPEFIQHLAEEIHDLGHSAQTMMDIMEREYKVDSEAVLKAVIKKNRERGYYGI
jgi:flagellar biosynthesis chaperone FliJ